MAEKRKTLHRINGHRGDQRGMVARPGVNLGWTASLLLLFLSASGCGDPTAAMDAVFIDAGRARALTIQAMEAEHPDQRRAAINRLASSHHAGDANVVRAMDLIARSDHSPSARTAAVVALGKADTSEACTAAAGLIPDEPADLPANLHEAMRTELMRTLTACAAGDHFEPAADERAFAAGSQVLRADPSRHARLEAARLLGYFPKPESLETLIAGLEQRDFGVCYHAEASLQRLTGQSFDHDPVAWRAYLAKTSDPFTSPTEEHPVSPAERWFGWLTP
jgi:HEAT repeat protein